MGIAYTDDGQVAIPQSSTRVYLLWSLINCTEFSYFMWGVCSVQSREANYHCVGNPGSAALGSQLDCSSGDVQSGVGNSRWYQCRVWRWSVDIPAIDATVLESHRYLAFNASTSMHAVRSRLCLLYPQGNQRALCVSSDFDTNDTFRQTFTY